MFFRQKFAFAHLGRTFQKSRGQSKRPGAQSTTTVELNGYLRPANLGVHTARPAGRPTNCSWEAVLMWTRAHSYPESRLQLLNLGAGGGGGSCVGQEDSSREKDPQELSKAISSFKLSLDFSFHPPFNPASFRPMESSSCNSSISEKFS